MHSTAIVEFMALVLLAVLQGILWYFWFCCCFKLEQNLCDYLHCMLAIVDSGISDSLR